MSDNGNDISRILLKLGGVEFTTTGAAWNTLSREVQWRWAEQQRTGKQDLLQYTGKAARTVRLEGEAHVRFGDSLNRVDALFDLGEGATPQLLVSGSGDILGYWVVTRLRGPC